MSGGEQEKRIRPDDHSIDRSSNSMAIEERNRPWGGLWVTALAAGMFFLHTAPLQAADMSRFAAPKAWQCTFRAEMSQEVRETTGPGGRAYGPQRQLFQALGKTGLNMENPGGDTDSYYQKIEQTVEGKVRLDYVEDGGPDGLQISGSGNGGAQVHIKSYFEGTEQNKIITRDRTATYDGFAKFEGYEYEPSFQIWINPDEGTYSLEYGLSPVKGKQVEHCRMKEGLEGDRKKAESATEADMPLGDFVSGLTQFTCPTERITEVDLEGGAFSALLENVPIPRSGLVLEGEGDSQFMDSGETRVSWSCRPE
ncbi:hypothetical protein MUP29_02525 [bacterium]|nr:hypothetical protein [bacterium]